MKKPTLIPALAIAALAAASLSLPVTASADSFKHKETTVVRGDHRPDMNVRQVHDNSRRFRNAPPHGHARWAPPRHQHDRGHHYGHRHQPVQRYEYRPVERYERRYDYRPVERYESRPDGDVRVRISYDLHL